MLTLRGSIGSSMAEMKKCRPERWPGRGDFDRLCLKNRRPQNWMVHHHFPINFSHFNDILRVTSDGVAANMGILRSSCKKGDLSSTTQGFKQHTLDFKQQRMKNLSGKTWKFSER
jgi:hypothetical protein